MRGDCISGGFFFLQFGVWCFRLAAILWWNRNQYNFQRGQPDYSRLQFLLQHTHFNRGQLPRATTGRNYLTSVTANSPLSGNGTAGSPLIFTNPGYITASALTPYLSTTSAASTYYLQSNPSGYITNSALLPYLSTTSAASTYYLQSNPSGYITIQH